MALNPFVTGTEVMDRRLFYGRKGDIKQLFNCIDDEPMQSVLIVGPRKSGKSSLLHHLHDPTVQKEWLDAEKDYLFVLGDFDSVHLVTPSDLYSYLLNRLLATLGEPTRPEGLLDAQVFQKQVKAKIRRRRLVFLLDGIEMAFARGALNVEAIKTLGDLAGPRLCYIVTADDTLDRLVAWAAVRGVDLGDAATNLNNTFKVVVYPSLLTLDEARNLILEPAAATGVTISADAADFVIELTGQHPFFLQVGAKYLFEGVSDLGGFSDTNAGYYRKRIDQACQGYFSLLWESLAEDERQVLSVLTTGGALPAELLKTVQRLVNKRLIVQDEDDAKPRPFGTLFGEFVARVARGEQQANPAQHTHEDLERCLLSITCDAYGKSVHVSLHGLASYVAECDELLQPGIMGFSMRARESIQSTELLKLTGQDLFSALFRRHDAITEAYTVAKTLVTDRRLAIRLRGPREFIGIPFELLHDGEGRPLALRHPIARMVTRQLCRRRPIGPLFFTQTRASGQRPRALLVAADVAGELTVDRSSYLLPPLSAVDEEVRKVASRLEERGWEVTAVASHEARLSLIQRQLESGGFHLFHFAGHGVYVPYAPMRSCLILRAAEGDTPAMLPAEWLHQVVRESDLRLAFLSCCQGAASGSVGHLGSNDFLGIIDALVTAGVPAAIGYRWPISDAGARAVALTFYDKIHQLDTLDEALLIARQEIRQQFDDETWAAPIMVLQG